MKRFTSVKRSVSIFIAMVMMMSMSFVIMAEEISETFTDTVAEVQKYGNLTMNSKSSELYDLGFELGDILEVTVGDQVLEIPFVTSYSDVATGSLLVRDDTDDDLLVVAINMGNFSTTYNAVAGDELTFKLSEKKGYLAEYLLYQLTRTYDRSDYATDSIFANFRSITSASINPGVIYRSSSPVNNEISRASYANDLAQAVGIKTVVNLADSKVEIDAYIAEEGFASDYYKALYQDGSVIALDMGVDVMGTDFGAKLAEGFRFISQNDGPYLIHCTEGKDRAGFASAMLEALMGLPLDPVVADYMTTYENYYDVEVGTDQYNAIAESNILTSLTTVVVGEAAGTDISTVDLAEAAQAYLLKVGMTADEITQLKTNLSVDSIYSTPSIVGTVEEIEKYGHTSTDILIEDFYALGFNEGDMVTAIFDNGFIIEAPFLDGYYVNTGDPLVRAYPGHTNIAVCINYGKLNEIADVVVGDKVTIMLSETDGYKVQYEIRKLERTNNRDDYASDQAFANFRNLIFGDIAEGVLYRSSSPIDPELGRSAFSDDLIEANGVTTVINMADSTENIAEHRASEDFDSPYYADLFDNNKVITLNMGLAYNSDEFAANIAKGLIFMSENDGPYLFHCTEGKDRAGFMGAMLGSLMGATKEEIVNDYMQSYHNYYGIEKDSEKYAIITEDVLSMLKIITASKDLDNVDFKATSEAFLVKAGMTITQIATLRTKLSTELATETVESNNYEVVTGDCLWNISLKYLKDGRRYTEIYELNKDIISNPAMIFTGQKLIIPVK